MGSHIFKHAIKDFLLAQGKTVVLVTHQVQYVPYAHQVGRKIFVKLWTTVDVSDNFKKKFHW